MNQTNANDIKQIIIFNVHKVRFSGKHYSAEKYLLELVLFLPLLFVTSETSKEIDKTKENIHGFIIILIDWRIHG